MIVGMNELSDKRPSDEEYRFPPDSICNSPSPVNQTVSRRITSVLLKDFRGSGLFKEIHCPAQPQDDYVISGSIERLVMQPQRTFFEKNFLVGFFPVLQLPLLFGATFRQECCIVDISLEIIDNKTNTVIANIRESSKAVLDVSIYDSELGRDVTEAFCNVVNKLKKDLAEKINDYSNRQTAEASRNEY
jgi:hypothetical protein